MGANERHLGCNTEKFRALTLVLSFWSAQHQNPFLCLGPLPPPHPVLRSTPATEVLIRCPSLEVMGVQ